MAYAAVKSLMHTIRGLQGSTRVSGAATQESLQSALNHAASLEGALKRCSGRLTEMDELIIIEESRKLEDAIEVPVSAHFFSLSGTSEPTFDQLRQDVDCFANTAKKMQENIEELPKTATKPSPKKQEEEEEEEEEEEYASSMVGLSDQFLQLRDLLTAERPKQPVFIDGITIWISGMAGIGKTRLARKLFHDPSVMANFEYRGFVRAGRDYVAFANEKKIMEGDDDSDESFWRLLTERKSLVVLDDVRENYHFFDHICSVIEDNGSRLLVTSRIDASMEYFSVLKIRFLNEEESWELLRRKVFVEEEEDYCPPQELVKAGKKIAEKCEGLPLLIIAVAPILLSKAQKNPEGWKRVAEKPSSVLEDASQQISEVLLSNYHQILEDEKSCFLYIAAFPLNYVVSRTTIGYLWYAEGLVHDWRFATKFRLDMLVRNNLVMSCQKGNRYSDDFQKACSLHCAYWYVSRRVAENNKFLYTINSHTDGVDERVRNHRRLAIYNNVLFAIKEVHNSMVSISAVRSLLCTGPYHQYQVPLCWEWKLLRVLSALTIRFYEFPFEVVKLICLKYLALTCNANLPPSISKLWNLQFLIVHQHSLIKRVGVESYLPVEIWDFQKLEHLEIMGRNLPDPPRPGVVLPRLEKLLDVGVESCTKEVLQSLPRVDKLRIQIELAPYVVEAIGSCFDHLSCLDGLHSFQSVVMNPTLLHLPPPPPLSISISGLNKLSLSGFGYHWEDMNKIGQLPKLEVLKLKCYAFGGEKWEVEQGFLRLRRLCIEDTDLVQWTAGDKSFPILSRLAMKNCHKLQNIPLFSSMYCVDMELVDCNPLAETCTKQKYTTHDKRCNVTASYSWNEGKVKSR